MSKQKERFDIIRRPTKTPREVLKWLQALELSKPIKNIKREFCSGLIVSEIFNRYQPKAFPSYIFPGCLVDSTSSKAIFYNWVSLFEVIAKEKMKLPWCLVRGTMYQRDGAAELLVCKLYTMFTKRKLEFLEKMDLDNIEFSDKEYQDQLPLYCKTTGVCSIIRNMSLKEMSLQTHDQNVEQIQKILRNHFENLKEDRLNHPKRFNVKPTVGELTVRRVPGSRDKGRGSDDKNTLDLIKSPIIKTQLPVPSMGGKSKHVQENSINYIEVHQEQNDQIDGGKKSKIHETQAKLHAKIRSLQLK